MINKEQFTSGDCPEFAETLQELFNKELPKSKLCIIRAKVEGDEYEEYGDTEYEDCHVGLMIDKKHYLDVGGLVKFKPSEKEYGFGSNVIKIEMIAFNTIKREDYSIYREYDGENGYEYYKENIYYNFCKLHPETNNLDVEVIAEAKEAARKYISENMDFFKSEVKKAQKIIKKPQKKKLLD